MANEIGGTTPGECLNVFDTPSRVADSPPSDATPGHHRDPAGAAEPGVGNGTPGGDADSSAHIPV
eukprot:2634686-Heterocapsa_arctica.AAC.1